MKTIEEVLALDSYSLSNAKLLPAIPGIYFCVSEEEIVYIGSSNNINKRWKAHHKTIELCDFPNVKIYCFLTDEYINLEKELINFWNPILNGTQFILTKYYDNQLIINSGTQESNNYLISLISNPEFSGECAKVLFCLIMFLENNNLIKVSQHEMASKFNLHPQNFSRALIKLEKMKVIEKGERIGSFYSYRLSPQLAWKGNTSVLKKLLNK
jgi:hypothetical protein